MAAADGEENDLAQLIQAAIRDAVYPLQQQMIKSQEQMRRSQQEINQLKAQQQLQNAERILEIDIDNPEDTSGEDFHGFDDNQDHGSDHGDDQRANQHGRQVRHQERAYFASRPRLRKPPCFDLHDGPKKFQRWKNDWQLHREQIALMGYTAAQQEHEIKVEFRFALSENTLDWMESRLIDYKDVDAAIEALEEFVLETTNPYQIYLECAKHNQREHETIDDLNMWVREKVKNMTTQFKTVADAIDWQHKVIFLTALKSDKTRKKLIEEGKDKDYAAWVEVAKTDELVEKKNVELLSTKSSTQIYHVSTYQASRGRSSGRGGRGRHGGGIIRQQQRGRSHSREHDKRDRSTSRSRDIACGYCGKGRHDREKCPAKDKKCFQCQRTGHFGHMCRSTTASHAEDKASLQQESGTDTRVSSVIAKAKVPLTSETGNVEHVNSLSTGRWPLETLDCIRVTLSTKEGRSRTIDMLPDTGANVNLIRLDDARTIWPDDMMEQTLLNPPRQVSGQPLNVHGYIDADLYAEDEDGQLRHLKDVRFIVSRDITRALLSRSVCKALGLIGKNFPRKFEANMTEAVSNIVVQTQIKLGHGEMLDNIATRYPEVFSGKIKGMAGGPCTIELLSDAVPTSNGAYRDIPAAYKDALKRELDSQVEAGILEKVNAPSEWLHPIVVVPKKGTSDIRLCVDLRRLNKFCKRPVNPQSTPWELVRRIPRGATHYAVFDALKGYHQIALDEDSKAKTTFHTPFGKYRYTKLPMGYAAAQDIFTLRMGNAVDSVLDGLRATEDCLIYAFSQPELERKLDRFFAACNANNITLNTKKIQIGAEVIFAGYKINSEGYQIDPALTEALKNFPIPTSQTDVRSFLGLVNQICNFTTEIAELMTPFKELLKKGSAFVWTDELQLAFEKAREQLATPKTLTFFDHRRPTRLYTDASRLHGLVFIPQLS